MKILIISGIFPPDIGGPASYVPAIAAALVNSGHEVQVLALSDSPRRSGSYPYRVVRLPRHFWRPLRWLLTVGAITAFGRSADVWYVNGLAMESALARLVARKRIVLKVVGDLAWERAINRGWTDESFDAFQAGSLHGKVAWMRRLQSWWTRQADRVVVPSGYLAGVVEGWGVARERIQVIYNAIETEPVETHRPAAGRNLTVATVARLTPWKGVDGVLHSVSRVPGSRLLVVGDGPERQRLESLAVDLRVSERVAFMGQRSRADTRTLLEAADLFVLNSSYEGFPHVVVEAMALGLPVVATRAGGTPEIVEDGKNGRLIEVGDGAALTRCLEELRDRPSERQRLSQAALETAQRFGFRQMVACTERVLEGA